MQTNLLWCKISFHGIRDLLKKKKEKRIPKEGMAFYLQLYNSTDHQTMDEARSFLCWEGVRFSISLFQQIIFDSGELEGLEGHCVFTTLQHHQTMNKTRSFLCWEGVRSSIIFDSGERAGLTLCTLPLQFFYISKLLSLTFSQSVN